MLDTVYLWELELEAAIGSELFHFGIAVGSKVQDKMHVYGLLHSSWPLETA